MAKRKRKKASQHDFPPWVWMLFGLAIGLSVAFAIYVNDREPTAATRVATARPEPASMRDPEVIALDNNSETAAEPTTEEEPRFSFYEMLPSFEVVVPEQEADVTAETKRTPVAVVEPGIYVLQAGSFSDASDADRRRAELALQGIESRVQVVTIDDKTYHRVRIGPTDDLDELNLLRSRLRQAKIDALRIRLGD